MSPVPGTKRAAAEAAAATTREGRGVATLRLLIARGFLLALGASANSREQRDKGMARLQMGKRDSPAARQEERERRTCCEVVPGGGVWRGRGNGGWSSFWMCTQAAGGLFFLKDVMVVTGLGEVAGDDVGRSINTATMVMNSETFRLVVFYPTFGD